MNYVQIDNFNGNINLVTKNDGSGGVLIFDSLKEAEDSLEENCQDGVIIPLDVNLIYLIKEIYEAYVNGTTLIHVSDLIGGILNIEPKNLF